MKSLTDGWYLFALMKITLLEARFV